jgi:hypothetical protein
LTTIVVMELQCKGIYWSGKVLARTVSGDAGWDPRGVNDNYKPDPKLPTVAIVVFVGSTLNSKMEWMWSLSYVNKLQYAKRHGYDLIVENESLIKAKEAVDRQSGTSLPRPHPLCFGKVAALLKWLPHYQWLMWIDVDTVIYRFDQRLESFLPNGAIGKPHQSVTENLAEKEETVTLSATAAAVAAAATAATTADVDQIDVIMSKDWQSINSGVFFLRNSPYSHRLLEETWRADPTWWRVHCEQDAMRHVAEENVYYGEHEKHWWYPPQRLFNAFSSLIATGEPHSTYHPGDFLIHFPSCGSLGLEKCKKEFLKHFDESGRQNGFTRTLASKFIGPGQGGYSNQSWFAQPQRLKSQSPPQPPS